MAADWTAERFGRLGLACIVPRAGRVLLDVCSMHSPERPIGEAVHGRQHSGQQRKGRCSEVLFDCLAEPQIGDTRPPMPRPAR